MKDLRVNLKNISEKGLEFSYSKKSQEMTEKLKPLIGDNDYNISIHIQSEGTSSYSVSGAIQTRLNLLCSRCAYEFKEPIQKKFKEKIFLYKKGTQKQKEVKNNHFSDLMSENNFTTTDQNFFDIGEFLHELIAIEEPLRPLGTKNCDEKSFHCEHLENMKQELKKKKDSQVFFSEEEKTLPL